MRTVAGKIMLKSGKLVDGFTDDECNLWLSQQGWIRLVDRWLGPGGVEVITFNLNDGDLIKHPCSFEYMASNI